VRLNCPSELPHTLGASKQLELSPFNQRRPIVEWCSSKGCQLSCASWSKLSNEKTGAKNWPKLKEISSELGTTKQQVLIAWALRKGYLCVPRTGTGTVAELLAIKENSVQMRNIALDDAQFVLVDSLDESLRSGYLGRTDGWDAADITGLDWDPTEF